MTIDSLPKSLLQRELGIFPSSSASISSSDSLWVQSIGFEYRVHTVYDGDIIGGEAKENVESLIAKGEELISITEDGSIENAVVKSSACVLFLHLNKFEEIINLLPNLNSDIESLNLKNYYLLSIAYGKLGDLSNQKKALFDSFKVLKRIPILSNIESNFWLNLLFDELFDISSNININELKSVFNSNENLIVTFIEYLTLENVEFSNEFIKEYQSFIDEISKKLLNQTIFPTSNESNNYKLEEFLYQISTSKFLKAEYKKTLIETGISKTYHSQILMHSLINIALSVNRSEEIKSCFEVFENYIESYYVLNNHTYNDILSILSLFNDVLNNKFNDSTNSELSDDDYHYYLSLIEKFKNLLLNFYSENDLIEVNENFDLFNHLINNFNDNLSKKLKKLLSSYWSTLANSSFIIHLSDHSIYSKNNLILLNSLNFSKNSIYLNDKNEKVLFKYILTLSILRKTKESFKLLKLFLKNLIERDEIYFKSWHLLSLILSIEENKEESFKIISFLINEINDYLNSDIIQLSLSLDLKQIFIQIKFTQLAIIESLFGIEQSLDTLPELFELFNKLFQNSLEIIQPKTPEFNHKKSLSIASVHTLSKIKSITPYKKKEASSTNPVSTTSYKFKQKHSTEQKILQKIWILSSLIYSKSNLLKEAEQSLLDAENCYRPNSKTHTTLGLLISNSNPKLALSEFEKALSLNRSSLKTIVGFSNLILNESNEKILFIDEKDKVAAIARVKLLLETASETFQGAYNSEVWWLLSLIYERFKDKSRLKQSLWKSVELEESRGVRSFAKVDPWF